MKHFDNVFILNDKNIGISKIELNKDELFVVDKNYRYSLCIHIYNWKEINNINTGEKKKIDFNEYCFNEKNESALIWPTNCYIEKLTKDSIIFYLDFNDFSDICYMNKRNGFDIDLKSIEVKIYINYNDAKEGSIIYAYTI
ncbi:MAG: hypothetical protein HFI09_04455 [Bacilli bacterium]|nr:hypothetical protein [Bacilli bacterium]